MLKVNNKKVKGFLSLTAHENARPMLLVGTNAAMAQNASRRLPAGTTALTTVTEEIAKSMYLSW